MQAVAHVQGCQAKTEKVPSLAGPWTFVGDVHGKLYMLPLPGSGPVVQVGDLGIGFISAEADCANVMCRNDFWFIRGNHDNPDLCRKHPRYLGDWGAHETMFWVSGAWSFDHHYRVEGVDWWRDEELSTADGNLAFEAYVEAKPRVMVTHDGPASLFSNGGPMELYDFQRTSTATLLQAMFEAHQPEVWLFGHHHKSTAFTVGPTHFRCLAICETLTLNFGDDGTITWPAESITSTSPN